MYELDSIRSLTSREYNVCSGFKLFHEDIVFLAIYFNKKGFSGFLLHKILGVLLNIRCVSKPFVTNAKKDVVVNCPS